MLYRHLTSYRTMIYVSTAELVTAISIINASIQYFNSQTEIISHSRNSTRNRSSTTVLQSPSLGVKKPQYRSSVAWCHL